MYMVSTNWVRFLYLALTGQTWVIKLPEYFDKPFKPPIFKVQVTKLQQKNSQTLTVKRLEP